MFILEGCKSRKEESLYSQTNLPGLLELILRFEAIFLAPSLSVGLQTKDRSCTIGSRSQTAIWLARAELALYTVKKSVAIAYLGVSTHQFKYNTLGCYAKVLQ